MKKYGICLAVAIMAISLLAPVTLFGGDDKDHVRYVKDYKDPVIKQMKEEMDSLAAIRDSITAEIDKKFKDMKKEKKDKREKLRFDFVDVNKPSSPEAFKAPFHYPPVPQYYTGTCWCFCTTSFMESEIKRLTGKEIKLSEIYTVYWEYVEKAKGYIQKRGNQLFAQGGESDGLFIIWDKYGVVPLKEYSGLTGGRDKHNHKMLHGEIMDYFELVKKSGVWDEETNIAHIRVILDKYLGKPPEKFSYKGKKITPLKFFKDILKVNTDDYIQVMSTLSEPFYLAGEFDVPDNWRPTNTYYNLPLDEFYERIKMAAREGYTVCIGGDVSEPGYNGFEDAAIIPDFDIPQEYINQDSRELRINNKTTSDDHGLHLVGYMEKDGRDWFLIKDSARSSRHGDFHGYYFYRDDYIKMKMLTYSVHKDIMKELEGKFKEAEKESAEK
jgi:bleomycin hydrolase